jgi:hypothetical protein
VETFDEARRAAIVQDLLRVLQGKPVGLLPFDAVREGLRLEHIVDRGVREVPVDRIVGTLGKEREREFNRAFLPRDEKVRPRWTGVRRMVEGPEGFPRVELYQVGDLYFVVDGHHRVSVLRAMGAPTIEAWVKEFVTPVPLDPDVSVEEVLAQRGYAEFLQVTGLVPEHPDDLRLSDPQGYERLLEHVHVHRHHLGNEAQRPIPWEEAVRSWRTTVYRPMVDAMRRHAVLEAFPGGTEADLYLYTMDHLHHLRERYGRHVPPDQAAREVERDLRSRGSFGERIRRWLRRRGAPPAP